MEKNEKEILKIFERVIPDLTELEREKLLSFGEGIAFKTAEQKKQWKKEETGFEEEMEKITNEENQSEEK